MRFNRLWGIKQYSLSALEDRLSEEEFRKDTPYRPNVDGGRLEIQK